jgi:multicomponent K+:H+ antiporter subunit G
MTDLAEYTAATLLVVAGVFGLTGSFGLLKLRDTMQRLHAPTKATTVGVGAALIASMVVAIFIEGRLSWHELLITLFLLLTAPITANFLAKAHMHRHVPEPDLPQTGVSREWATYEDDAVRPRIDPKT